MAAFFATAPGQVTAILDTGIPIAMRIGVGGWLGSQAMKAIITGLSVDASGMPQYLKSLRNLIHVYSFGEDMGRFTFSGVTFSGSCGTPGPSGLESVLQYYNSYRFSRAGAPVSIALGSTISFPAFLTRMQAGLGDPALGLGNFAMQLDMPPRDF